MKKMDKILVLRTAKMQVVELLMNSIGQDCDITFLAQSNIVDKLADKYPFAKVISIGDIYFNFTAFCGNVHLSEKFDRVYVLASGIEFTEYEEVFAIVEQIKCRQVILFNKNGIADVECRTVINRLKENVYFVFAWVYMKSVEIWYKHFGKKYRF